MFLMISSSSNMNVVCSKHWFKNSVHVLVGVKLLSRRRGVMLLPAKVLFTNVWVEMLNG